MQQSAAICICGLMIWAATAAAQEDEPSGPDLEFIETFNINDDLCPKDESGELADAAGCIDVLNGIIDEVAYDCMNKTQLANPALCRVELDHVRRFCVMYDCGDTVDRDDIRGVSGYLIGKRLQQTEFFKIAMPFLEEAYGLYGREPEVLRTWMAQNSLELADLLMKGQHASKIDPDQARILETVADVSMALITEDSKVYFSHQVIYKKSTVYEKLLSYGSFLDLSKQCVIHMDSHEWEKTFPVCYRAHRLRPSDRDAKTRSVVANNKLKTSEHKEYMFLFSWLPLTVLAGLILAFLFQGSIFYVLREYRLALAAYSYFSLLLPRLTRPRIRIIDIHEREGNEEEELIALQKALTLFPKNTAVLQRAFDYYARHGDLEGISNTIIKMSDRANLEEKQIAALLEAQRELGLVEMELLNKLEEQLRSDPDMQLLPLVALAYEQQGRMDDEALAIYRKTLNGPRKTRFYLPLARAELCQGQYNVAWNLAQEALQTHPSAEAVDCLTDAIIQSDLGEEIIWQFDNLADVLHLLPAWIRASAENEKLAPMIAQRLEGVAGEIEDSNTSMVIDVARRLIQGEHTRNQLLRVVDQLNDSIPFAKSIEACIEEYARRNPEDASIWMALADIHARMRQRARAYQSLDRAKDNEDIRPDACEKARGLVSEMAALELVESLALVLGLQYRPLKRSRRGYMDVYLSHATEDREDWMSSLEGARLRIMPTSAPNAEDVLDLIKTLRNHAGKKGRFAMLISEGRPSVQATELMMTSMVEDQHLSIFPIEIQNLRESLAEFGVERLLDSLHSQWLLKEDLFDKKDPVRDAAEFYGRGQILRTLVHKAHRSESFGLFGLRKMGKTSLAHRVRRHLADAVVGMVDLQEVTDDSAVTLAQKLCERAIQDWHEKFVDIPPPQLEDIPHDDTAFGVFEHNLRTLRDAILDTEDISTLFLMLDEIERMIPHRLDSGHTHEGFKRYDEFFRLLRGLHQTDFKDVFAFAVIGANAELCLQGKWAGIDNPIFQYLTEAYLGPLDFDEMGMMVTSLGRGMGLSFEDDVLRDLFGATGGHPMVTRQVCSVAAGLTKDRRPVTIDAETIHIAMETFLVSKKDYFDEVLNEYLDAGQRAVLDAVAAEDDGVVVRRQLLGWLKRRFSSPSELDRALQQLDRFSLVDRRGDQYSISILLLRKFIRIHRLDMSE